jgi:ATP synthase protein I
MSVERTDSTDSPTPTHRPRQIVHAFSVGSIGIEMGLCVAIGCSLGLWLDSKFDTSPWLLLLFLAFGIAAAFKAMSRAAREARDASRK